MFTGIVEGFGIISGISQRGQGKRLKINAEFSLGDTKIGDSIAVNGACLTVVKLYGKTQFEADVAPETIDRTILKNAAIKDRVNLERALLLSDRLHGHIVSGHIDGVGKITRRIQKSNAIIITIKVSTDLNRYMIEKGSVAVDGTSLTINRLSQTEFDISIIPHTAQMSSIGEKRVGEMVNIETDMIGKYIDRLIQAPGRDKDSKNNSSQMLNAAYLKQRGFL